MCRVGLSFVGLIPDCIFLQSIAKLQALETRCTHCSPIVEVTEPLRHSPSFFFFPISQILSESIFFLCVASSPSIPLPGNLPLGELNVALCVAASYCGVTFSFTDFRPDSLLYQVLTALRLQTGGRTAWSSSVKVQGRAYAARYWYDGNFTINAKHDAAEVALTLLTYQQQPQARSETLPGKVWP